MGTSSTNSSWLQILFILSTLLVMPLLCDGSVAPAASQRTFRTQANSVELELRPISHTTVRRLLMADNCAAAHDPEALATPNPLMEATYSLPRVTVSFIVGRQGEVESPLILESSAEEKSHNILKTLRQWRYRPAMCNGVPIESEAEVQFSSR